MGNATPDSKQPRLEDPRCAPTVWASELASIEVQGPVTILTFAELRREGLSDAHRQICARVAIPTVHLSQIASRIEGLKSQAAALASPTGNA